MRVTLPGTQVIIRSVRSKKIKIIRSINMNKLFYNENSGGYPNVNPLFLTQNLRISIFSIPWYCKASVLQNSRISVMKSLGQSRNLSFQQNKLKVNSCHLWFQLKKSFQKFKQMKISGYINIQVMMNSRF